jgi:hypothetical protein
MIFFPKVILRLQILLIIKGEKSNIKRLIYWAIESHDLSITKCRPITLNSENPHHNYNQQTCSLNVIQKIPCTPKILDKAHLKENMTFSNYSIKKISTKIIRKTTQPISDNFT